MIPIKEETKDEVIDVRQVEVNKKQRLIGSMSIKKGHTLFEINVKEKTIEPAKFEDEDVLVIDKSKKSQGLGMQTFTDGRKKLVLDKLPTKKKTLIKKKDCVYIPALNLKNVHKKLEKLGVIKIKHNIKQ